MPNYHTVDKSKLKIIKADLIGQRDVLRKLADAQSDPDSKSHYEYQANTVCEQLYTVNQQLDDTTKGTFRPPRVKPVRLLPRDKPENNLDPKLITKPAHTTDKGTLARMVKFYRRRLREAEERLTLAEKGEL